MPFSERRTKVLAAWSATKGTRTIHVTYRRPWTSGLSHRVGWR